MQQYLDSIKLSLETKNYFSAIALSLAIPDICGSVEYGDNSRIGQRYCGWFNKYLAQTYKQYFIEMASPNLIFGANECYAARCSFLHQGTHIIKDQLTLKHADYPTVSSVRFISLGYGEYLRNGDILFLDVSFFCENMINAVETWMKDISSDCHKMKKIEAMPIIHETFDTITRSTNQ